MKSQHVNFVLMSQTHQLILSYLIFNRIQFLLIHKYSIWACGNNSLTVLVIMFYVSFVGEQQ